MHEAETKKLHLHNTTFIRKIATKIIGNLLLINIFNLKGPNLSTKSNVVNQRNSF